MFLYGFTITFVKLGVIAFYFCTFPGRILHVLLWVSTAIVIAVCVGSSFLVLFQCSPIYKFWKHTTPGTCISFTDYIIAQAIPNIITDFLVLALPIGSLYRLSVSPSKKAALLCIFLVGYFVTGVSIARAIIIRSINPVQHKDLTCKYRCDCLLLVPTQPLTFEQGTFASPTSGARSSRTSRSSAPASRPWPSSCAKRSTRSAAMPAPALNLRLQRTATMRLVPTSTASLSLVCAATSRRCLL